MVNKLKKRIRLSVWGLTSLVLLVFAVFSFVLNSNSIRFNFRSALDNYTETVITKIRLDNAVSTNWINTLEAANNIIIGIKDNNGNVYLFSGNNEFKTSREVLLNRTYDMARENGVAVYELEFMPSTLSTSITVNGDNGDTYLCKVTIIPIKESYVAVSVILSNEKYEKDIENLLFRYILIIVILEAILYLISKILAEYAVKPTIQSERSQREFIASVSHELRSPLAVIKAASSTAQINGDHTKLPSIVDSEVNRMSRLVEDLMTLSKADTSGWEIETEDIDLDDLTLNIYEKIVVLANNRNRSIRMIPAKGTLPVIKTNGMRLTQIILIFFNNACEYSTEGKEITFGVVNNSKWIKLYIGDRGPGIPDKEKKKIFERFYRADKSRSDKKHFGLGLSVAMALAKAMNMEIGVDDNEFGGSDFYVRFNKQIE